MYKQRKTETEKKKLLAQQVREHYDKGLTMREIAQIMNRSYTWVWYKLKEPVDRIEEVESLG